jgi:hypothetical protein
MKVLIVWVLAWYKILALMKVLLLATSLIKGSVEEGSDGHLVI